MCVYTKKMCHNYIDLENRMSLASRISNAIVTAGSEADEIRVDFEILKLLYRLNYSEFYVV